MLGFSALVAGSFSLGSLAAPLIAGEHMNVESHYGPTLNLRSVEIVDDDGTVRLAHRCENGAGVERPLARS